MEKTYREILARCTCAQRVVVGTLPNGKPVLCEWPNGTATRRVSYDNGPWTTPAEMLDWCRRQDAEG